MKYFTKQLLCSDGKEYSYIFCQDGDSVTSFIANSSNPNFVNFKKQINADEAQLEDADGNLMTAEQAKEFVKELP